MTTRKQTLKNTAVSNGESVEGFNQGNELNGCVVESTWEQRRGAGRFHSPPAPHQLFGLGLIRSTL